MTAKAEAGRLRGFLQDLVEEQGRVQVADRLGVSERTLRRALASPQLTPHMTQAREIGQRAGRRGWGLSTGACASPPSTTRGPAGRDGSHCANGLRRLKRSSTGGRGVTMTALMWTTWMTVTRSDNEL